MYFLYFYNTKYKLKQKMVLINPDKPYRAMQMKNNNKANKCF